MSHSSLSKFYDDILIMKKGHGFSIQEVESMLPFERDYFIEKMNKMEADRLEEERLIKRQLEAMQNAARQR